MTLAAEVFNKAVSSNITILESQGELIILEIKS